MPESRFQLPRTRPSQRPAPFPIGAYAKDTFPKDAERVIALPELILTLATPFVCGGCDGARTDFLTQTRSVDRAIVPCWLCQGEGAILPGETLVVDQAVVQRQTQHQIVVEAFGRLRSPWMGANDWRDTFFWCKQLGGIASAALLEQAVLFQVTYALLHQEQAPRSVFRPFGLRSFVAREMRFATPIEWPASWTPVPTSDITWTNLATFEANPHP